MITNLIITAPTMRRLAYIFNYMCDILHDHVVRCSRIGMEIVVCDIKTKEIFTIRFMTEEKYDKQARLGNRARVMTSDYLENQLDKLHILKKLKEG